MGKPSAAFPAVPAIVPGPGKASRSLGRHRSRLADRCDAVRLREIEAHYALGRVLLPSGEGARRSNPLDSA
jgi:hypothetical protein